MRLPPDNIPALVPARTPSGRALNALLLVLLGLLAVAGVLAWTGDGWLWHHAPSAPAPREDQTVPVPPDPRLAYKGPYLNVRPEVKYVGDAACANCHAVESEGFHRHPMGRSILPADQLVGKLHYDKKFHNPFTAMQSRFSVQREGDRLWHVQQRLDAEGKVLAAARSKVDYVIGSGRRGHSFFTVQDGFLFQTPISWYSQKQIWEVSPGFTDGHLRVVVSECIVCHSGGALPVEHTENRYEGKVFTSPAIGCERCHGPGEAHVAFRAADKLPKGRIDHTIVNPRHLEPALREAICQQCHLEGEARVLRRGRGLFDYRPGLPLQDFWAIYIAADELKGDHKAVGHVEQMVESKCFQKSKGRLGCATCHDVHQPPDPARRVGLHRAQCLQCHEHQHPCTESVAKRKQTNNDSCFECHMTQLHKTDIAHTATTDHRILRKPDRDGAALSPPFLLPNPLVPFHRRPADDPDADRDLGIALVRAAQAKTSFSRYLSRSEVLLEKARARDPNDVPAMFQLALLLSTTEQTEKGLTVADKVLALVPRHELALRLAAMMATSADRPADALKYWERLLAVSPRNADAWFFQATLLARTGKYERAIRACRKLLELDPIRPEAWTILAHCYGARGAADRAAEARKMADALKTPESERFKASFLRSLK